MRQALARAREVLGSDGDARRDAEVLLAYVIAVDRAHLLAHPETTLTAAQAQEYEALLARRADRAPVAYLTGVKAFYDRNFFVRPGVLIPRPETEHLVEEALAWAERHPVKTIADIGTGAGAIAVTLAANIAGARVIGADTARDILEVAAANARLHRVNFRVAFMKTDLMKGLEPYGPFAIITANLPYIPSRELEGLEAARFEPRQALDGGPDGLQLIRALLEQAPAHLAAPGLLLIEIGQGQAEQALALARAAFPTAAVSAVRDYAGIERVVRVEKPS